MFNDHLQQKEKSMKEKHPLEGLLDSLRELKKECEDKNPNTDLTASICKYTDGKEEQWQVRFGSRVLGIFSSEAIANQYLNSETCCNVVGFILNEKDQ